MGNDLAEDVKKMVKDDDTDASARVILTLITAILSIAESLKTLASPPANKQS